MAIQPLGMGYYLQGGEAMSDWLYKPGELAAWSKWLRGPKEVLPTYTCTYGHKLESPIPLTQAETDARCMGCNYGEKGDDEG